MIYQCQDCFDPVNKGDEYCKSCLLKQYKNQYGKKAEDTHEERLDEIRNNPEFYAFTKERIESQNKFYAIWGKSWYLFQGIPYGENYKVTWIDQFRNINQEYDGKRKPGRPRKNKGDM